MNYIKGFWSSATTTSPNGEIQSQPNTIHRTQAANFNSVTISTNTATSGNSIIITTVPATPQNTQQIVYHNQHMSELKPSQMTSPTDSFHSAASNFEQKNSGKINLAYAGSSSEINNSNSNNHHHHNHHSIREMQPHNSQAVVREQYWSWSFPWTRWNSREKIFLIVIIVLSLCVLALTSVLSVVLQKNLQYKETPTQGDEPSSIIS